MTIKKYLWDCLVSGFAHGAFEQAVETLLSPLEDVREVHIVKTAG